MTEFHTGEKTPSTGTYKFVKHMENTACQPTKDERNIPLSAGETFPPCKHCKSAAVWSN